MKSKTSFFNPTVFKKDVTRFAPCWGLYTLMMVLFLLMNGNTTIYSRAVSIADIIGGYSGFLFCYALVVTQLLFGDLYNSRMCNALHALPLRRECWFATHVIAGLAFALVPNAAVSLIAMPLLQEGWSVALWWLLGSTLEYLFFFGLAVLCAMCVGNRFAMALVYGIVNFLSMLAYWFANALYEPLLTGVRIPDDPFITCSPLVQMCDLYGLVDVDWVITGHDPIQGYTYDYDHIGGITIGEGWGYLAICAVIGAALLGLALFLYRRRKLECAGDFMAVRILEPVFLVLYTLTVGCLLHLFCTVFVGRSNDYVFLAIGITVGFFTGLMLLNRTIRIFKPKAFLGLGVLAAAVALSLFLTSIDIFGITRIIPDKSEIESIRFGESHSSSNDYLGSVTTVTEDTDIENILYIHRYAIGEIQEDLWVDTDTICYTNMGIEYTLTDGSTLRRYYTIPVLSTAGGILKDYYSDPEVVLDCEVPLEELAQRVYYISFEGTVGFTTSEDRDAQQWVDANIVGKDLDVQGLLDAITADCETGAMVQQWEYHNQYDDTEIASWLSMDYHLDNGDQLGLTIKVFRSCENTLRWLEENGLYEAAAE